jgi:pilus assembly protein CpaB
VVAAGLVFFWIRGAEQRAVDEQQPVTVLVSTATIPRGISLGDAVSGGLAQQTQVPANTVPAGAITSVSADNTGLLALNNVNAGQILLSTNFVSTLPDISPVSIPDGLMAISIEMGDMQKVGNFLRPGSEVVVFDSYSGSGNLPAGSGTGTGTGGSSSDLITRVLVNRAVVLGIGETASVPATNPDGTPTTITPSSLITLGVDQSEAEKIIQASQTGSLYFGLLGNGTDVVGSNGTTAGNLFN